eukprot:5776769-Prymnesium_polylepis.1
MVALWGVVVEMVVGTAVGMAVGTAVEEKPLQPFYITLTADHCHRHSVPRRLQGDLQLYFGTEPSAAHSIQLQTALQLSTEYNLYITPLATA